MKPRMLFVANAILGWNSYSKTLAAEMTARTDIDCDVIWHRPSRLATLLVKRHAGGAAARLLRPIDPLTANRSLLGRSVRRAVRRLKPDVVHFASHLPAAALSDLPGNPPFTVSLDCTRPNINALKHAPVWPQQSIAAEARLFRAAAHIFPMSDWAAASLMSDHGIAADRITMLPPSIHPQDFHPKQDHGGPCNIVFVGNDFARKGGNRLVAWMRGPLAGRCHLHIVSGDPKARIDAPHVTAHGQCDHATLFGSILPRMDVLCLPTQLDMSPHVLVEAAAAGLPVVASDIGGIPSLVEHGRTGFLVNPDDDDGFVAALLDLSTDTAKRNDMGRNARALAQTRFDARTNATAVIETLRRLAVAAR